MSDRAFAAELRRRRHGKLRLSHAVALAIVAVMVIFVLGVVAAVVWNRDPAPAPTLADLTAAQRRWQRHGPASYDLKLETRNARRDQMELQVRDGKPTAFTVNGQSPSQRRVWETWTVPRQFEYIRDDMSRPVPPGSAPPLIRVEFDSQTGLPWQYTYAGDQGFTTGWKILSFTPVP